MFIHINVMFIMHTVDLENRFILTNYSIHIKYHQFKLNVLQIIDI